MLPSGLPEVVDDAEELARFLTQSGHFGADFAKPSAFLPDPKPRNTSVFRRVTDSDALRRIWRETTSGGRPLKAVAIVVAAAVRSVGLDVVPEEPPPRHANLERWPWLEGDASLQKAKQLEIASRLAVESRLLRL